MTIPPLDDLGQLADMAMAECSRRDVRWQCPFCSQELPDEHSPHCGEAGHAQVMTDGDDDE